MTTTWKRAAIGACVLIGAWLILRQPGPRLPTARLDASELVRVISRGEKVALSDHVSASGWTIVEFSADW